MSSIGKSPRFVNRVKSELTVTGRRSGTPTTPGSSQIPVPKTPLTPQTVHERKKFLTRRKLVIGDAKPHLTCSSPASSVQDFVHRATVCSCDPELQGPDQLKPNCIYVNVCTEHVAGVFRWREYLKRLWRFVGTVALLLVAFSIVVILFQGAFNAVYWMFGGKSTGRAHDPTLAEDERMFYEEETESDGEELNRGLVELNPNAFSLTETTHAFNLLHVLIMTLARLFGWIGGILLPDEG
ncbi:uncharacterized protein LOC118513653 [Anopheles stephensi]|uniref:uncharacterized protein LOC118513653 n=1 Tax=Anopheles stephensi TaxID=30069 RepID=UPI00165884E7|nr:uncharacterized protein LOC118513653 [Anopheles stephensi]